jgi:hypothetical protein
MFENEFNMAESTSCTNESINYFSIENLDSRPTFKLLKSKRIRNIEDRLLIDAGRRFAIFMVNVTDTMNMQKFSMEK